MTTEREHLEPSPETQKNAGPGAKLRQARIDRNLDQEQIADQLHLSKQQVEAIEQDDYSYVSALAYARGHLRLYAKMVGLSANEILKAFDTLGLQEKIAIQSTPSLKSNVIKNLEDNSAVSVRSWAIGLLSILFLIIIVGVMGYYLKHTAKKNPHTTTVSESPANVPAEQNAPSATTSSSNVSPSTVVNVPVESSGPVPLPIPPASETQIQSNTPPVLNNAQTPDSNMPRGDDRAVE